jgi:hypothetical protein
MIAAAQVDMDEYVPPSVLSGIKEKILATDLINQLDIADGLKELLISKSFTLKLLLDTPVSGLAKILCIDNYVASIIHNAVKKVVRHKQPLEVKAHSYDQKDDFL